MTNRAVPNALRGVVFLFILMLIVAAPLRGLAAPYAAMVMDARTGEVLHSRNADTPLHPASLTKMMTLYIAFQAVQRGEIGLDTEVTITRQAAEEEPSRLGLRAGQKIRLRYLLRAAAVKSANDAATAIGIAKQHIAQIISPHTSARADLNPCQRSLSKRLIYALHWLRLFFAASSLAARYR